MKFYKIKLKKLLNREVVFCQSIFPYKLVYSNFIDWFTKWNET